jgi:hypothetical protein
MVMKADWPGAPWPVMQNHSPQSNDIPKGCQATSAQWFFGMHSACLYMHGKRVPGSESRRRKYNWPWLPIQQPRLVKMLKLSSQTGAWSYESQQ